MTTNNPAKGAKPTHRIYIVTGEGNEAKWTPIAACWPNKDGKGFNIECTAVPLQGRLVMREARAKDETNKEGALS